MSFTSNNLVVCGTDTDVGKTIISAMLVQGLGATYWKPIQSGLECGGDRSIIANLLKLPKHRLLEEAYIFQAPVSPHWAAEKENCLIQPERLKVPSVSGPLIIETAGGLMVPINRKWLQIDQLKRWQIPVVLVARSGLGTLNHTLLSIEALRTRKIPIIGLILNGPLHPDNPPTLEQIGNVPVIAQLPPLTELSGEALAEQWQQQCLGDAFKKLLNQWN